MTTCLGKSCFFRFTVRVFRERLSNFVCVLLSLLVLRVGCGMGLYLFPVNAFLFTLIFETASLCAIWVLRFCPHLEARCGC